MSMNLTVSEDESIPVSRRQQLLVTRMREVMKGVNDLRRMRGLYRGKMMMTEERDPLGELVKAMKERSVQRFNQIDCELFCEYRLALELRSDTKSHMQRSFLFDWVLGTWCMLFSVHKTSVQHEVSRNLIVLFFENPMVYIDLDKLVWGVKRPGDLSEQSLYMLLNFGLLCGRPNDYSIAREAEQFFRESSGPMDPLIWRKDS